MVSKWRWLVLQLTRTLWIRAALFCLLAVLTALLAIVLDPLIPVELPGTIGADAVDHILDILASSMLAVTTFSLTVMVSAYSAATNNVTPRATGLLLQDTTSQNVLSTFLGTFLFSLVGIIALSTGAYGRQGRVVLFVVSLFVIVMVVLAMLRWIDHLSRFGQVADTTQRVEQATLQALAIRMQSPYLGGMALINPTTQIPRSAAAVLSREIGYIQHLDVEHLSRCAEEFKGHVYATEAVGSFVHTATPLAWVDGIALKNTEFIHKAFTIGPARSFDQDPRFGLRVLSEIASKALSPAMNDPGTAIDVISRAVRILSRLGDGQGSDVAVECPRVWVPPITAHECFDDIFTPIARDGAGLIEVQLMLQKAFYALAAHAPLVLAEAALQHSKTALTRAQGALVLDEEKLLVSAAVARLKQLAVPQDHAR